jgi:hypothetical protein
MVSKLVSNDLVINLSCDLALAYFYAPSHPNNSLKPHYLALSAQSREGINALTFIQSEDAFHPKSKQVRHAVQKCLK